jgi:hypothetical protein
MVSVREAVIKLKVEVDEASQKMLDSILEKFQEVEEKVLRKPTLGRTVWYRGSQGYLAMRMAFVACTVEELIEESVMAGSIQPLDSEFHVHLHVITPSVAGFFTEFNVPMGKPDEDGMIPPGTWCWPKLTK